MLPSSQTHVGCGCESIAPAAAEPNSALLHGRRADEVIVTTEENVVDAVKRITARKLAYAAVDCVAGEITGTIAAAVRPQGTVLVRSRSNAASRQLPACI